MKSSYPVYHEHLFLLCLLGILGMGAGGILSISELNRFAPEIAKTAFAIGSFSWLATIMGLVFLVPNPEEEKRRQKQAVDCALRDEKRDKNVILLKKHLHSIGVVTVAVAQDDMRDSPTEEDAQIACNIVSELNKRGINAEMVLDDRVLCAIKSDPVCPQHNHTPHKKVLRKFVKRVNAKYLLWLDRTWLYQDQVTWRLYGFQQGGFILKSVVSPDYDNPSSVVESLLDKLTIESFVTVSPNNKPESAPWEQPHCSKPLSAVAGDN